MTYIAELLKIAKKIDTVNIDMELYSFMFNGAVEYLSFKYSDRKEIRQDLHDAVLSTSLDDEFNLDLNNIDLLSINN